MLHSLELEGDSTVMPLHTILELWRVKDLKLLRVLPEASDEINTAAWNPIPVSFSSSLCALRSALSHGSKLHDMGES